MAMIYAMSDIHGYYDLMVENLKLIDLEDKKNKLIFCGDYIDYGSDSSKVLYKIKKLMEKYSDQVIALKGNHETMFLEFLEVKDSDVWNIEWLGADKELSTINTFLSEGIKDEIKKEQLKSNNSIETALQIAKLIKEDIKRNHRGLITWLKTLALYYETEKQIFVHAGVDEGAGDWWKYGTSEEVFFSKYPATFGKYYKDIIAGHIGTNTINNEEGFYGVYWDGESHYYIDGTVEESGRIPLLIYDSLKKEYIY